MPEPCAFYREAKTPYCTALKSLQCRKGAKCSFRKTLARLQREHTACILHLHHIHRADLIDRYSSTRYATLLDDVG